LEAGSLCGELDKLEMSAMFPKPMFPKPGTAEFDEFVREMGEFARFLTDPKECFRRAATCEQRARDSTDKKQRDGLLRLAKHWRALGIHYEIKAKFPIKS
jgi:hypothetical protein